MKKELRLSLKRKWFEMTKAKIKSEDYRNIDARYCKRFLLYLGEDKSIKWWLSEVFTIISCSVGELLIDLINRGTITFKKFIINTMTLGYPSANDRNRILNLEHKGIEIRTGNPEWGA